MRLFGLTDYALTLPGDRGFLSFSTREAYRARVMKRWYTEVP